MTINDLIADGKVPQIHVHEEEDGSYIVEWVFPNARIGLSIDEKEPGWFVVSKQITASGPL